MRVISGVAKGKKLSSPPCGRGVRPVTDRVKESLFSILFDVAGRVVLDIFAGSGAVGIEALSRGATRAVFIESSKEIAKVLIRNLRHCCFLDVSRVITMDCFKALALLHRCGERFDLVFMDPPYHKNLVPKTLSYLSKIAILYKDALIVAEHHLDDVFDVPAGWSLTDQRKYGQTVISFFRYIP